MKQKLKDNLQYLLSFENAKSGVADYVGVDRSAVTRWGNGKYIPDLDFIPSIAEFFGVTPYALMSKNLAKSNYKPKI